MMIWYPGASACALGSGGARAVVAWMSAALPTSKPLWARRGWEPQKGVGWQRQERSDAGFAGVQQIRFLGEALLRPREWNLRGGPWYPPPKGTL